MSNQEQQNSKKLKVPTILGIIFCLILIPILISNLVLIIKGYANPGEIPGYGKTKPLIVLTDSMEPTIHSGDLILIREIDFDDVEEGDIISYFESETQRTTTVTHRVIEIIYDEDGNKLEFVTQGDANNIEDSDHVTRGKLIGVYKTRIPILGSVAIFLKSTPGLIVAILVPLGLLLGYDVIRRKLYDKKNEEDTNELLKELELLRAEKAKAQAEEQSVASQEDDK